MIEFINKFDNRVVYVLIVLLVVLLVVSIVKKLIKTAIVIVIICAITSASIPAINSFKENYGISITDNVVSLKVNGESTEISKDLLESIIVIKNDDNSYTVNVPGKEIKIPGIVFKSANKYIEEHGMKLNIKE